MRTEAIWGIVCVLVVACSDGRETAPENLAHTSSALDQYCKNARPDDFRSATSSYLSPRTYSNPGCYKGVVVDWIQGAGGAFGSGGFSSGQAKPAGTNPGAGGSNTGGAAAGGLGNSVTMKWGDSTLGDQTLCEETWLGAYHFSKDANGAWIPTNFASVRGVWDTNLETCFPPEATFANIRPNARIAASARWHQTTSSATAILQMQFRD